MSTADVADTFCRAQKTSLWGWALGSVCTVVSECYELSQLSKAPASGEGQDAWEIKRSKAQAEINTRMFTLVHALFQVGTLGPCPVLLILFPQWKVLTWMWFRIHLTQLFVAMSRVSLAVSESQQSCLTSYRSLQYAAVFSA